MAGNPPRNVRGPVEPLRVVRWLRLGALLVVVVVALALLHGTISAAAVHREAARLNGFAAFALLVVLPLVGFPVSVLHVAAGIRWGGGWGMVLVALSIGLQLAASYALVHRFRPRFEKRFAGLRRRIPPGAHASICVFTALLPGAPFAAINYVLPLIGVRLRTILLCCWPLDILRATVTVFLGDQSDKFTPVRLAVLGAYALALGLGSWWLYHRLRRQLADRPAAEDGRMQPV